MGQHRPVKRAERVAAISQISHPCGGDPGRRRLWCSAVVLALASGFLFCAVPVRQVLRTDPYQIVKSGSTGTVGRRLSARDLLLVVQIAICAVLVTSSLVAVRGLVRSLHGKFGFEPQNAILADTELALAGYSGDKVPE